MSNLIVLIVLSIASLVFLWIIRRKGNKAEALSFLSTMIATLFGVLLAITLSDRSNKTKEVSDTIKLLKSASNILDRTHVYVIGLETYIQSLEKDSLKISEERLIEIKKNNPVPYPQLMEKIVSNEIIAKNLSDYTHNRIFTELINLQKISSYGSLPIYKRTLKELSLLFSLEEEFQKGVLTEPALIYNFEQGRKELAEQYPIGSSTTIWETRE
ncbi:conserved hypothetical protein [Tenacibaculum litopenaei]|uniref:hypothetical protein n=1 Tax=Tenacibaculum litopenaei TaxID=396016 RepID=UPI0038931FE3